MINSDNVVRGGLTPKYKDTDTLVKMLKYEFKNVLPNRGTKIIDQDGIKVTEYRTGYHEFMVTHVQMGKHVIDAVKCNFKSMAIAVVLKGKGFVNIDGFGNTVLEEHSSYYILPNNNFTL